MANRAEAAPRLAASFTTTVDTKVGGQVVEGLVPMAILRAVGEQQHGQAQGEENKQIAERLGIAPNTALKWCKRFFQEGLAGLADRDRPGRSRAFSGSLLLVGMVESAANEQLA